jgi:hypothetical protein
MKGIPLTPAQRQQIIDLRQEPHNHTYKEIASITGRPYNTVAHILRDEGLHKEPKKIITLIYDPAGIFPPGQVTWNQCDLAYMLGSSALQDGFTIDVGSHRLQVQDNCFIRDDGLLCPASESGSLKWYKAEGAE